MVAGIGEVHRPMMDEFMAIGETSISPVHRGRSAVLRYATDVQRATALSLSESGATLAVSIRSSTFEEIPWNCSREAMVLELLAHGDPSRCPA